MPKVLKIEEPETKSNWWVWILVIIGGLILFSIIKDKQQEAEYENKMKQEVVDINYCRSKAAEYGKQGDAIFSKVYNDCMDTKGW